MSQVSDALALSMRAHNAAKAVRHKRGAGDNEALLTEAQKLRLQAHNLDPKHGDPAWEIEQLPPSGYPGIHERLLAFYERQLA